MFLSYKVGHRADRYKWSYDKPQSMAKNKHKRVTKVRKKLLTGVTSPHIKIRRGPAHPVVVSGVCLTPLTTCKSMQNGSLILIVVKKVM